jgi:hypothetical protein
MELDMRRSLFPLVMLAMAAVAGAACGEASSSSSRTVAEISASNDLATVPSVPSAGSSPTDPTVVQVRIEAPDRVRFDSIEQLLSWSSMVAVGRVEELGESIAFGDTRTDGAPSLVATLTKIALDDVLFGSPETFELDEGVFLQNGGTYGGVRVELEGEPIRLAGERVLVFAYASADSTIKHGYWVTLIMGIGADGRLDGEASAGMAPFLKGLTVDEAVELVTKAAVGTPPPTRLGPAFPPPSFATATEPAG